MAQNTKDHIARQAVENERENFRNLFRQTPEMVCILTGAEHRFEFVNDAHIRALGFDATGKTVREAQPESVEVHGLLDQVFATGVTAELHEIPVTLGNRRRFFNLTYAARRDEHTRISGVMILGAEVTEEILNREGLRLQRDALALVLRDAPLAEVLDKLARTIEFQVGGDLIASILIADQDGKSLLFGAAPGLAVDYNNAVHGMRIGEGEGSCGTAAFRKQNVVVEDIQKDPLWALHRDLAEKNGLRACWSVPIMSAKHKLLGTAAIYARTIRRATERELQVLEVAARTTALVIERIRSAEDLLRAKEEAERANELKSAFLANMSHEIRTPLGAMIGFADLLRDPGLSGSERSSYIDILSRNGESLAVIINDILDLSKVEAGHLTLEYTDSYPRLIVEDVVSLLRVKAKEKDLTFEYLCEISTPEQIVSDPIRLRQILVNIVSNAVKFTHYGSVRVRSYGCKTHDDRNAVCFEITDSGIGIPESQKEKVFEMFVQADGSMTRRFGGTGLGLALSRSLARSLGGDITVEQTVLGKGSTFLIKVEDQEDRRIGEATRAPEEKTYPREISEDALRALKILVVDDAPDNRQLIWHYLSKQGAIIDTAENGLLGYRKALSGQFDIVLMDIQMPEMDGYTATQKLRSAGYRKPIIALTAHAMGEVRQKCLNVGCNAHLPKPINPRDLVAMIVELTHGNETV